jgi:hypothetical protein
MSKIEIYENKQLNQKVIVERIPEFNQYHVQLFKNGQLSSQAQLSSKIFNKLRNNGFMRID